MRSAIIAAAFAASVIAVPMEKRNVVVTDVNTDVVYVTQYYTVTAGQETATTTTKAAATPYKHWGHNNPHWWGGKGHTTKKTTETTVAAAPTTTESPATWAPAPTTSTTESSAPAYTSAAAEPATGYQGKVMKQHNLHRANHSASDLVWDAGLASTAQKIANLCIYEHNTEMDGGGYGQNIAAGVDNSGIDRIITDMFYNGEVNYYAGLYGQASPDMSNFEHWGHFSQIVWKQTSKVGCATTHCSGGLQNTGSNVPPYFTVCNYDSPGNVAGQYTNVGSSLDHPTVTIA